MHTLPEHLTHLEIATDGEYAGEWIGYREIIDRLSAMQDARHNAITELDDAIDAVIVAAAGLEVSA